jgi:hypothetical protein
MTDSVPASTDNHDRCPLCESDWHGLTGDGISGRNGCPGECGSDEEKKRWLKRPNRAFWESVEPSDEEYVEALAVAYDSGDEKEFGAVLCEVSTSGFALEVLTAFMQLNHGLLGN